MSIITTAVAGHMARQPIAVLKSGSVNQQLNFD